MHIWKKESMKKKKVYAWRKKNIYVHVPMKRQKTWSEKLDLKKQTKFIYKKRGNGEKNITDWLKCEKKIKKNIQWAKQNKIKREKSCKWQAKAINK